MPGALDDLRVLDLSWGIAGSLGVLLLAEQGADVVKIEPPGGDPFRDYSGFAVWNRSRRSVTLDLKQPDGVDAFMRLVDGADVVVETFRNGVAERLGIPVVQPERLEPGLELGAATVVAVAYGRIVPEPLLGERLWLNVHPSLLPRWRGAGPRTGT